MSSPVLSSYPDELCLKILYSRKSTASVGVHSNTVLLSLVLDGSYSITARGKMSELITISSLTDIFSLLSEDVPSSNTFDTFKLCSPAGTFDILKRSEASVVAERVD